LTREPLLKNPQTAALNSTESTWVRTAQKVKSKNSGKIGTSNFDDVNMVGIPKQLQNNVYQLEDSAEGKIMNVVGTVDSRFIYH
jgi:hypothetical protein